MSREVPKTQGGFWLQVAPALLYAALVFYGGTVDLPQPRFESGGVPLDKVAHFGAFALMQLLWWRAIGYELPGFNPRTRAWLGALLATLLGGTLELYQSALPHRSADLLDFAADAFGAVLAALLVAARARDAGRSDDGLHASSRAASSSLTKE